jgi:hypothetical protein
MELSISNFTPMQKVVSSTHPLLANTNTQQFSIRALLVGMMHVVAGSAALIVMTIDSVSSIKTRLVYIFLWVGSVVSMALFSLIIIIPFGTLIIQQTIITKVYRRSLDCHTISWHNYHV